MHKLLYSDLENYILSKIHNKTEDWMENLKKIAIQQRIPIMDDASIHFVRQLIRIVKPKKILEIGTGIGYSALMMHDAYPYSEILTIEKDSQRYEDAMRHIQAHQKENDIHVINGDALDVLNQLPKGDPFDLVLIDASKGQYQRFFEHIEPYLSDTGIVISDNVFLLRYVIKKQTYPTRYRNIVNSIQAYNDWLAQHSNFDTSFLPIGDGLAVSVKH